jgi:SAM-dependent methyltransferase
VLDLGARSGSFHTDRSDITVVRLDMEIPKTRGSGWYVAGDAARMPFAAGSFHAIVSNHSLEHFVELDAVLGEIGRVAASGGSLYIAVPDAGTLCDGIYRWLARGGGHVNPFRSPEALARLVERRTGLPHRVTWTLYASLSFLNINNLTSRPPRRAVIFGRGNERFLAILVWILRLADGWFGTRLSQYGWSFYFGGFIPEQRIESWINVCVRCGSGQSENFLRHRGAIPPLPRTFDWYRCPTCGGLNLLTHEEESHEARPR